MKREISKIDSRFVSWRKILTSFLITIVIFSLGVGIGSAITTSKVNEILSFEKEARLQLETLELEEKLLETIPCTSPSLLSGRLDDLGSRLVFLENQYDKDDERILELKRPYTILEIRHYLKLRELVDRCEEDYTMILFFYSNEKDLAGVSEEQGFVLDYLQKKYTADRVKIYSFDNDLNLDLVNTLKGIYEVDDVPSMVINGKLYVGFHDKKELEQIIE